MTTQIPRLDFELTESCDHRCAHCYNVWNAPSTKSDLRGPPLDTEPLLDLMSHGIRVSGAEHITLTGGEPMLRQNALRVIEHACSLVRSVTLITNGSHISPDIAADFARWGLRAVQLTLLAGERQLHDRLKGAVCFDDSLRAALDLADAGVSVQACFVAMRANAGQLRLVMELCAALGIDYISYNRMSPSGRSLAHIDRLMPTPAQIEADLEVAERLGRQWEIKVGTAMPIPPCLVRTDHLTWVRRGFCSTGSETPNIVVDAWGDVRSCNLSANVLGNLLRDDWEQIINNPYLTGFRAAVPELCRGCYYEVGCQGGCKESAANAFGSHTHPEPLLWMATEPGARKLLAESIPQQSDEGDS